MAWVYLFIAGLLEAAWVTGMKLSEGFTRPLPSLVTVATMIASFYLLALSLRTLPVGMGYAVWVGIGALGASVVGVLVFEEPLTLARSFFLGLLLIAVVGLKLSSS